MCFDSLIDGDATEKPLRQLVSEEMSSALKDAGVTTVTVALVLLLAGGVAPGIVAAATVVAFFAGVVLHQAVLVVGVGLVRLRARSADRPQHDPTTP